MGYGFATFNNHRVEHGIPPVHLPCGRKDPKGARSEQLLIYMSVLHFQYYSTILKKDVAS